MEKYMPKIGVISLGHATYWPQFQGLKEELSGKAARFIPYFSDRVTVEDFGFADTADSAFEAVRRMVKADLDGLFIVMATYVPSAVGFPFMRYLKNVPQVLVGIQPLDHLDYKRTTTYMQLCNDDICSMPEFAGVYARMGCPVPGYIIAAESEREKIAAEVALWESAMVARAAFKYATFGYLGHTYDGMYDMNTDPTAFSRTFGAHVKMLEMCELVDLCRAVTDGEIKRKVEEIRSTFEICDPSSDPLTDYVQDGDLEIAARTSVALDRLVDTHSLSALAYYYKGEGGNEYERIASNLIIGNTLLTSRGIPLAGEADLKTAAAMLIMSKVGGGGSFAELHPFDVSEDIVLIGHDGPHHIGIAQKKPILRKLKKFHGKSGSGVSVEFSLKNGDMSLLSCSVDGKGDLHLIGALGESMPGDIPMTGNTNTRCHFATGATEFVRRWCEAGPTHHLALGVGNRMEAIARFARISDIKFTRVL